MTDAPDKLPEIVAAFRIVDADRVVTTHLPEPITLARLLRQHIEADVAGIRRGIESRGGVQAAEDTFAFQRHLVQAEELMAQYVRVFGDLRKHLKRIIEEVLSDAVGEQAGVPLANLTVPDADGDIRITRDIDRTNHIDTTQVLPAFATLFADQHVDALIGVANGGQAFTEDYGDFRMRVAAKMSEAIVDALTNVGQVGKFEPQVSKVKALAKELARSGHDSAASVVAKSITTTDDYKGIRVERAKDTR